jgi:hypothetical protein
MSSKQPHIDLGLQRIATLALRSRPPHRSAPSTWRPCRPCRTALGAAPDAPNTPLTRSAWSANDDTKRLGGVIVHNHHGQPQTPKTARRAGQQIPRRPKVCFCGDGAVVRERRQICLSRSPCNGPIPIFAVSLALRLLLFHPIPSQKP